MLPKARIPDPGPKALESIRLSVFVLPGEFTRQVSSTTYTLTKHSLRLRLITNRLYLA